MDVTEKIVLEIEGMHCIACEKPIARALKQIPGVMDAHVCFINQEAVIIAKKGELHPKKYIQAIQAEGYQAYILDSRLEVSEAEKKLDRKQLTICILSFLLSIPLFFQVGFEFFGLNIKIPHWIQFIFASIIQWVFGWRFYLGSYFTLKKLATGNEDFLICLATTIIYVLSVVVYFFDLPDPVHFSVSGSMITIALIGSYLRKREKRRTSSFIRKLQSVIPQKGRIRHGDHWMEVKASTIHLDDVFIVRSGEIIPVDGIVIEGSAHVDESLLIGKCPPNLKTQGSFLLAGTQNQEGMLIAKTTKTASKTTLSAMIRTLKEAEHSLAAIEKNVRKISLVFIPIVIMISIITFFTAWGLSHELTSSLIKVVSVLAVAAPSTIGLSLPSVIRTATGVGAKYGILFKKAHAFEKAKHLNMIILNKAGTVTEDEPKILDVVVEDFQKKEEIFQIAASLEALSKHPLATALSETSFQKLPVEDFFTVPGKGVMGKIQGIPFIFGSLEWMKEKNIVFDKQKAASLQSDGHTLLCLSTSEKILGFFIISDPLRPTVKEAVTLLHGANFDVAMMTADDTITAKSIAKQAGILKVFARILPQEKAKVIQKLKKEKYKVGFVGTDNNDHPSLAAADLGFAMRKHADLARDRADITLMQNDLKKVPEAIHLSKTALTKINQNILFSLIYNFFGIIVATTGYIHPILAVSLMVCSELIVIGNALLINHWSPIKVSNKRQIDFFRNSQ